MELNRSDSVAERLRRAMAPTEQQSKDQRELSLNDVRLLEIAGGAGADMPHSTRESVAALLRQAWDKQPDSE